MALLTHKNSKIQDLLTASTRDGKKFRNEPCRSERATQRGAKRERKSKITKKGEIIGSHKALNHRHL